MWLVVAALTLVLFASVAVADDLGGAAAAHAATLRANGLEIEPEALRAYLESLHPDGEARARVRGLIRQLGDESFSRREAATQALLRLPVRTSGLADAAAAGDDPEVRWRAAQVEKLARGRVARLLFAVFSVIEAERMPGLAEPLLTSVPVCEEQYLQEKAAAALRAIVGPQDVPVLREVAEGRHPLTGHDPASRVAAVTALEAVLGSGSDDLLRPLLGDADEIVRTAAGRALLNHGNRAGLVGLGTLLESESPSVRVRAIRALRGATGQEIPFAPHDPPEQRQAAARQWQQWIAGQGQSAELIVPLREAEVLFGRTLLTNYTQQEIIELDAQGEIVWRAELPGVWACRGLPNGHRLVASYTGKMLVEYDATGEVVWKCVELPDKPYDVQRLPNGNTLVPCYNGEIVEVRPDHGIAWRLQLPERAKSAQALENGNILLVLYSSGRVVEIDRSGEVVWEAAGMDRPYSVQRLSNGNTLVANRTGNRVVEIDRQGTEVWSYEAKLSLYQAQRLPDGGTLVVGSSGVVEVDRQGREVWSLPQNGLRGAHRY
jgi:outer membrane protein assembly factor BamB